MHGIVWTIRSGIQHPFEFCPKLSSSLKIPHGIENDKAQLPPTSNPCVAFIRQFARRGYNGENATKAYRDRITGRGFAGLPIKPAPGGLRRDSSEKA